MEDRASALRELYRMRRSIAHLRRLLPEYRRSWDELHVVVFGLSQALLEDPEGPPLDPAGPDPAGP